MKVTFTSVLPDTPVVYDLLREPHFGATLCLAMTEGRVIAIRPLAPGDKAPSGWRHDAQAVTLLADSVWHFLSGQAPVCDLPLLAAGTKFQQRVWREIAKIPYGATISYTELARRAGNPKAVRAAASACGANPIPLLIPCHRVIAQDGSLGGFGWGLSYKQKLLALEQTPARRAA